MRCREARRLLVMEDVSDYGAPRQVSLDRHLRGCGLCREEATRLDTEAALLRAAFGTLPLRPDFAERVRARIAGST